MEESRIQSGERKKPTVIFDKRDYPFVKELSVGDTGSLDVIMLIEGICLEECPDLNERMVYRIEITRAEQLDKNPIQLV